MLSCYGTPNYALERAVMCGRLCAPRAVGNDVRQLRRSLGTARRLNFTVRRHLFGVSSWNHYDAHSVLSRNSLARRPLGLLIRRRSG
jgi:hypothetical protein